MRITLAQYGKAKELMKKLRKQEAIVAAWEKATERYAPATGHRVTEIHVKDGKTRFITEADEEAPAAVPKRTG